MNSSFLKNLSIVVKTDDEVDLLHVNEKKHVANNMVEHSSRSTITAAQECDEEMTLLKKHIEECTPPGAVTKNVVNMRNEFQESCVSSSRGSMHHTQDELFPRESGNARSGENKRIAVSENVQAIQATQYDRASPYSP